MLLPSTYAAKVPPPPLLHLQTLACYGAKQGSAAEPPSLAGCAFVHTLGPTVRHHLAKCHQMPGDVHQSQAPRLTSWGL